MNIKAVIIAVLLAVSALAVTSQAQIPGDFNCNGYLDAADIVILSNMINLNIPPIEDTSGCTWYAGDANDDSLYHTISDWMQFVYIFSGDTLGDNPPQPEELDSLIMADTIGVPGESLVLPLFMKTVDDLSGIFVQLHMDTLFFENLSVTPGSDSLDINQYIADDRIFLDHIFELNAGYYHLADINFSVRDDAPPGDETTIELVSGDYYPSAFANVSLPTYLIRPVLINGTVYIQRTGIDDYPYPDKPSFNLSNFPNPFNSSTIIRFSLEAESHVELAVFDILGRQIDRLVDGDLSSGDYRIEWDARDRPSGVYFYRLITQDAAVAGRMMLLR
jgi:hypothetical protein